MMTMERALSCCVLAQCILVAFLMTACGSLSPKDQAQADLNTAQQQAAAVKEQLDETSRNLEAAQQKYTPLKKDADNLSQLSVNSRKASSVDDPRLDNQLLSPNTAPARKKAADALGELNAAKTAKEKAQQEYSGAQATVDKARTHFEGLKNSSPDAGGINGPLLLHILPPLFILLFLTLLSYLFRRHTSALQYRVGKDLRALYELNEHLTKVVDSVSQNVSKVREEIAELQGSFTRLGMKAREVESQGKEAEAKGGNKPETLDIEVNEIEEILPDFPTSVIDYLDKERPYVARAKPDRIKGMLVKDADGQLMVVQGTGEYHGRLLAIPRTPRFKTVQDYNNHFEKYYDCNKPSSGEVRIDTPAIVTQVDGGWELDIKGVLEIR